MKNPLVSIIVPTYKRPGLLKRTLRSLYTQVYDNLDIVVVNDYPEVKYTWEKDGSGDSRVRFINNKENKGLAGTRNVAMEHARGDYFIFLDDDDILLPLAIDFRINMMKRTGSEIVYTRALQDIWEERKYNPLDPNPDESKYVSVHKQLYWDSPFDRDLILIQNIAPCCCPMFSRKAWDDSGNYKMDEEMTTTEDHDFWCALSRNNYFHELKLVDAECSYRTDKTQMSGSLNFVPNWIITFKRWRHTAKDLEYVTEHQNNILQRVGIKPGDYGL